VYGPVRTVVWQGSVGDRRPYADQTAIEEIISVGNRFRVKGIERDFRLACTILAYTPRGLSHSAKPQLWPCHFADATPKATCQRRGW
jgi:hypothetical protein